MIVIRTMQVLVFLGIVFLTGPGSFCEYMLWQEDSSLCSRVIEASDCYKARQSQFESTEHPVKGRSIPLQRNPDRVKQLQTETDDLAPKYRKTKSNHSAQNQAHLALFKSHVFGFSGNTFEKIFSAQLNESFEARGPPVVHS